MIRRIIGASGFVMTCVGMSSLDSEGTGYSTAVLLSAIGLLFLLYWAKTDRRCK